METTRKVVDGTESECGPCQSDSCEGCSKTGRRESSAGISRPDIAGMTIAGSAAALLAGCTETKPVAEKQETQQPAEQVSQVSLDLAVVQASKGPVMTQIDEFFKMGPGPSSSHTMGPMRITYDFYQRISKLPDDQLKRATALKVNLFGSLSATGKGHGTDRAALAGLLGKAPATCPPQFLDSLSQQPDAVRPLKLGPTTLNLTLKDVEFDDTNGKYPHPKTMRIALFAGNEKLYEQEYYSVGGASLNGRAINHLKKASLSIPTPR